MNHPSRRLLSPLTAALAVVAAGLATFDGATAATPGCAEVEVHQVRPKQGFLMLAAYSDAENFNRKPLVSLRLPAGDAVTRLQLCGLPADGPAVAITMYQDLDGDGQMGKNLIGVPTEPWGSSGSPGAFGPTWATARVPLDGKPIVVRLSS